MAITPSEACHSFNQPLLLMSTLQDRESEYVTDEDLIQYEDDIVWLEDIGDIDYVRELLVRAGTRVRGVNWNDADGHLVGYSVLHRDAPSVAWRRFNRRVFYVTRWDRYYEAEGTYKNRAPDEAVDPRTVAPGVPGRKTPRSKGQL